MELCSHKHDEIVHDGGECPVCGLLEMLEGAEQEVDSVTSDLDSMADDAKELHDALRDVGNPQALTDLALVLESIKLALDTFQAQPVLWTTPDEYVALLDRIKKISTLLTQLQPDKWAHQLTLAETLTTIARQSSDTLNNISWEN